MADNETDHCRLCLVTPAGATAEIFAPILDDALDGGDVASLIVTAPPADLAGLARVLIPIAQDHGTAVLIHNDAALAEQFNADGAHIDDLQPDLAATASALRPNRIFGVGGLTSRHDAMAVGELDPDYVFFGRLDGDTDDAVFAKAFDLAAWWASLFQIPAIVMGGASLASVEPVRDASIEFVALGRAIWEHPSGPRAAVAEANRLLAAEPEKVP